MSILIKKCGDNAAINIATIAKSIVNLTNNFGPCRLDFYYICHCGCHWAGLTDFNLAIYIFMLILIDFHFILIYTYLDIKTKNGSP